MSIQLFLCPKKDFHELIFSLFFSKNQFIFMLLLVYFFEYKNMYSNQHNNLLSFKKHS